jgi:hypothetical protein
MLNELIAKAYNLDNDEKKYLLANMDDILSILCVNEEPQDELNKIASGEHPLFVMQEVDKKKKKPIIHYGPSEIDEDEDPLSSNTANKPIASPQRKILTAEYLSGTMALSLEKTAKVYDPETPENMLKVVDLIEKFLKSDNDISHDSMSIFLYPLSRGAKRIGLRPFKLVGLTNDLWGLCRKYDSCLTGRTKSPSLEKEEVEASVENAETPASIRKIFKKKLSNIKARLNNKIQKKVKKDDITTKPTLEDNTVFQQDKMQGAQGKIEDISDHRDLEKIKNVKKSLAALKEQGMPADKASTLSRVFSIAKADFEETHKEVYGC